MNNGVDLYPFGYSEPCQTYRYTPVQERNFPFTVAFVGRGNGVVCGSPTGKVVVWDTKTGDRLQTLTHGGSYSLTIYRNIDPNLQLVDRHYGANNNRKLSDDSLWRLRAFIPDIV